MEIDSKLLSEIEEYCKYNDISDIEKEVNFLLRKGFNMEKYGSVPFYKEEQIKIPIIIENNETKNEIKSKDNKEDEKVEKPKKRVRIIKNK